MLTKVEVMGAPVTIVYVEDSPKDRQVFRSEVAPRFANVVEYLAKAEDFLDRIQPGASCRIENPGIILIDVDLPGMSGFELVRTVRQDYQHLDLTPLIIVTGSDTHASKVAAKAVGADWFLGKPVTYIGLQDALTHVGFQVEIVDRRPRAVLVEKT